jgi:DNA repair exonuclease SbcCD ATPase subunit
MSTNERTVLTAEQAADISRAIRDLQAENERLKSQREVSIEGEKKDCERAMVALAGCGICTPQETYGINTSWAISDLIRAVKEQRQERERLKQQIDGMYAAVEGASRAVGTERESHSRTREALRQAQWGNPEIVSRDGSMAVVHLCPLCDQSEARGHSPDCLVGMALEGGATETRRERGGV